MEYQLHISTSLGHYENEFSHAPRLLGQFFPQFPNNAFIENQRLATSVFDSLVRYLLYNMSIYYATTMWCG